MLDIITCVSFFQLCLITFFNPTKVNVKANKWFALFFFSAGLMMLNLVIQLHSAGAGYYRVIALNELSRFIIAPALYFVIIYYTSPNRVFKLNDCLHFIPFGLMLVYALPFIISHGDHFFSYRDIVPAPLQQWLPLGMFIFLLVQMCCYFASSTVLLYKHQKSIKLINADVSSINLNWLQYLLYTLILMLVLLYAGIFFNFAWVDQYRPPVYLAGVLLIGYFVIAQKEIYPFEIAELKEIDELIAPATGKIAAARLSAPALADYTEKLKKLMETEKLYLHNDLNLPQLANAMNISTQDLSYVINSGLNITFFKFVNFYRIAEAKRLLLSDDNERFNILGIAYNSGFNSKSTFNSTFKKETGLSPSQFINQAKATSPTPLTS